MKPTKPSPRARDPQPLSKDEQVDHIIRMMSEGRWQGAKSHGELAELWGIHPRTVSDRACEASAVLKRAGGPVEEFVTQKLLELEALQAMATKEGDVSAAVKAIELQGKFKGALVQKVEKKDVTDRYDEMSPAERIAELEKAIAEERAKLAETRH